MARSLKKGPYVEEALQKKINKMMFTNYMHKHFLQNKMQEQLTAPA